MLSSLENVRRCDDERNKNDRRWSYFFFEKSEPNSKCAIRHPIPYKFLKMFTGKIVQV